MFCGLDVAEKDLLYVPSSDEITKKNGISPLKFTLMVAEFPLLTTIGSVVPLVFVKLICGFSETWIVLDSNIHVAVETNNL